MRRNSIICTLIIMMLMFTAVTIFLTGCGGDASTDSTAAEDISAAEDASSNEAQSQGDASSGDWKDVQDEPEIDISALGGPGGVDVDLTKLSSTMVYAVVNDMMVRPNDYIGKKVRMNGAMSTYHDEETGNTYYACIIKDATACCAQGIEFSTTDEFDESDYPPDGSDLTVVGDYDLYEENGYQYCILYDAVLE